MTLLEDGTRPSKIRQGVTTEILGEDTSAGPGQGKALAAEPFERAAATHTWTTLGGYFDALEKPGNRRQRRQLRRAGHAAGMRAGRFARPPRPRRARGDARAPRRGDARRGARPLDHARQPPRAGRHDRRPGRALPGGQAPWRPLFVAHPQRRDGGLRCRQGSDRRSAAAPAFRSTSSTSRSPISRSGDACPRSSP